MAQVATVLVIKQKLTIKKSSLYAVDGGTLLPQDYCPYGLGGT